MTKFISGSSQNKNFANKVGLQYLRQQKFNSLSSEDYLYSNKKFTVHTIKQIFFRYLALICKNESFFFFGAKCENKIHVYLMI